VAISSNLHPSGFDELMPKTLAAATVDRLLHHAHLCDTTGGDSVRLAQATAGRGVVPLIVDDGQGEQAIARGCELERTEPSRGLVATSRENSWPSTGRTSWPLTVPRARRHGYVLRGSRSSPIPTLAIPCSHTGLLERSPDGTAIHSKLFADCLQGATLRIQLLGFLDLLAAQGGIAAR
jgi:hypothetical protein